MVRCLVEPGLVSPLSDVVASGSLLPDARDAAGLEPGPGAATWVVASGTSDEPVSWSCHVVATAITANAAAAMYLMPGRTFLRASGVTGDAQLSRSWDTSSVFPVAATSAPANLADCTATTGRARTATAKASSPAAASGARCQTPRPGAASSRCRNSDADGRVRK